MMQTAAVIGMQWGDEGKGKIVDLISPTFGAVVRYQGGHNAGHTVEFEDQHFALHLIPSGILRESVQCLLGNGMVISPEAFFAELSGLEKAGINIEGRLFVSDRAHVILPDHVSLDRAREAARSNKIGTTGRGIGPAYESKAARFGLRIIDLFSSSLEDTLRELISHFDQELEAFSGRKTPYRFRSVLKHCRRWAEQLEPYVVDVSGLLRRCYHEGVSILFEGAQGMLLDIDHGTYPNVTSSNPSIGGVSTGSGFPANRLDYVLGVLKAYTTRVGSGSFPTELFDDVGRHLGRVGNEFGTTTGRPRRCGWLDLVAARHACWVGGVNSIALTKLDVLDGIETVKVCIAYKLDGEIIEHFPADEKTLRRVEPVYTELPGWMGSIGVRCFEDLPENAKAYVEFLERELGVPVSIISTGPRREETALRPDMGLNIDFTRFTS